MTSALYWGRVTHHRYLPKTHGFSYEVAMFSLYLDELDELRAILPRLRFEGAVTRPVRREHLANQLPGRYTLRRRDFLPEYHGTLEEAAREMYVELTGANAPGRISMLANLRSLGWNFNPITLYFFHDGDEVVRAVAEVTNTPWGERHLYLLGPAGPTTFPKAHHVSPFLEMDGTYRLNYQEPGERFALSMSLHDLDDADPSALGPRRFAATMSLERHPLDARELARLGRRFPDMAMRGSLRIYLQAARLFAKRIKYVPNPSRSLKGSDDVITR